MLRKEVFVVLAGGPVVPGGEGAVQSVLQAAAAHHAQQTNHPRQPQPRAAHHIAFFATGGSQNHDLPVLCGMQGHKRFS